MGIAASSVQDHRTLRDEAALDVALGQLCAQRATLRAQLRQTADQLEHHSYQESYASVCPTRVHEHKTVQTYFDALVHAINEISDAILRLEKLKVDGCRGAALKVADDILGARDTVNLSSDELFTQDLKDMDEDAMSEADAWVQTQWQSQPVAEASCVCM